MLFLLSSMYPDDTAQENPQPNTNKTKYSEGYPFHPFPVTPPIQCNKSTPTLLGADIEVPWTAIAIVGFLAQAVVVAWAR